MKIRAKTFVAEKTIQAGFMKQKRGDKQSSPVNRVELKIDPAQIADYVVGSMIPTLSLNINGADDELLQGIEPGDTVEVELTFTKKPR